jgi:hypothetical protein
MSDVVLADRIHRKFYSDLEFTDFSAKIGLKVTPELLRERDVVGKEQSFLSGPIASDRVADTSPIELPPLSQHTDFETELNFPIDYDPGIKAASAKGVDVRHPAPMDMTFAGYAMNDEQIRSHIDKNIGTETRMGEDSGQIEYLNPKTNRWTTINPIGADKSDFEPLIGESLVIGADIAGGVGGSFISPLVGTASFAAIGAYAGEMTRLAIGRRLYGLGADMPIGEWISLADEAARMEAGLSLAGGAAGGVIRDAGKHIANWIMKRWVPEGAESIAKVDMADLPNQKIADEINRRIKGRYRPLTGELFESQSLLQEEEILRKTDLAGPEIRDQFLTRDKENVDALKEFHDQVTGFKSGDEALDYTNVGERAVREARRQKEAVESRIQTSTEVAEERAREAREIIPSTPTDVAVREARRAIEEGRGDFREWANEAYTLLGERAGNPDIPNRHTAAAVNKLHREIDLVKDYFPSASKDQAGLIGKKFTLDEEGALILNKVFDKDATFTFEQANLAISSLKSLSRSLEATPGTNSKAKGAVKLLIRELAKDRAEGLRNHPELYADLLDLERSYKAAKTIYYEGKVKEFMQTDGTSYRINDQHGFNNFLLSNLPGRQVDDHAAQFRQAIGNDEEALKAVRNAIYGQYKREVYGDVEEFSLKRHRKFIEKYSASMKPFFSNQDWNIIRRSGSMGHAFEIMEKRKHTIGKMLERSTKGEVSNRDPQEIKTYIGLGKPSSSAISELKITNLNKIKEIAKKDQALWNDVKISILKDMRKHAFSGDHTRNALYPDRFGKYLDNNRPVLKEVFGEAMVKDLELLKKAMTISSQRSFASNPPNTAPTLFHLLRMAVLGPLSHTGYVLGGVSRFTKDQERQIIADSLLSPESIKELVELSRVPPKSLKASVLMGSLIGTNQ